MISFLKRNNPISNIHVADPIAFIKENLLTIQNGDKDWMKIYLLKISVTDIFKDLIGIPSWHERQGYGSFLTFEFGSPKQEIMPVRKTKSSNFPASKHRTVSIHGDWHLWIYCCGWKISQENRLLANYESEHDKIEIACRPPVPGEHGVSLVESIMYIKIMESDDGQFIKIISNMFSDMAMRFRADELYLTRVDNWFDHKWLGFSGKLLFELETGMDITISQTQPIWKGGKDVTLPPFSPNRIEGQWHYKISREQDSLISPTKQLHFLCHKNSAENLQSRVLDTCQGIA